MYFFTFSSSVPELDGVDDVFVFRFEDINEADFVATHRLSVLMKRNKSKRLQNGTVYEEIESKKKSMNECVYTNVLNFLLNLHFSFKKRSVKCNI